MWCDAPLRRRATSSGLREEAVGAPTSSRRCLPLRRKTPSSCRRAGHPVRGKDVGEVKHLSMRFVGSVAGALALVASLAVAAVGTAGNETAAAPAPVKPPNVPNAKALKAKFGGTSLTFLGDGPVGKSHTRDQLLVAKFSADTGIKVKLVPHPADSSASYSQLARTFSAKSSAFDVMMLDVIWPGAFAPHLVDLKPKLGAAGEAALRGHHREQHGRRQARRHALVRRLRHALLPHRPAAEVRLSARRRRPGTSWAPWRRRSRTASRPATRTSTASSTRATPTRA